MLGGLVRQIYVISTIRINRELRNATNQMSVALLDLFLVHTYNVELPKLMNCEY